MQTNKSILVLGAGLVGLPIAKDLAVNNEFAVSVADIDTERLQLAEGFGITPIAQNLKKLVVTDSWVQNFDFYVNAVPGAIGFELLGKLIQLGKPIVDIAFFPEDPTILNESAIRNGSCVICDMGVAPGMSHLLTGYAGSKLEEINNILIYVGGLPAERKQPWEYKAVFSPADVIEEYTRPARLIEFGKLIEKPALSDIETLYFEGIGTLEAFNSDGLRSLVSTMKADFMAEKTLRYPGHADKIKLLRDSGFLSDQPIKSEDYSESPLSITKKILFKEWQLQPGEIDYTIMRIIVEGKTLKSTEKRFTFELFDQYDSESETHSMARTTGYAATAALRLIDSGLYTKPGIHFPEIIGKNENAVKFIIEKLQERNIYFEELIQNL